MDIAIIPSYNPDETLLKLIPGLKNKGIHKIIVVNDGSDENSRKIFNRLDRDVILLNHEKNRGKGAAIKTGLKFILDSNPDVNGIVLLDADGQHKPEDAAKLLKALHEKGAGLVLGVRSFQKNIPLRSLFGNIVTKYVFRITSGKWVSDTQTGLRAFKKDMIPMLLNIKGDRYEYEMNVLVTCAKKGINLIEVPIATIYHDKSNSVSHFRTFRDSVRIYGNLLAFSGSSFLSFLLDYCLFFLFVRLFSFIYDKANAVVLGNIAARIISGGFNYYLNSTFIFPNQGKRLKTLTQYIILASGILFLNTVILYCLYDYLGINKAIAKLLTELLLFIVSFTVQKFVIFNKSLKRKGLKDETK
jgi:glycosyltransferase involved in cell wall biosynthesis